MVAICTLQLTLIRNNNECLKHSVSVIHLFTWNLHTMLQLQTSQAILEVVSIQNAIF